MKRTKKQNGITLVALVITIIILLILAGISLQLIAENDGLLRRTSMAENENEIATVKETVVLYVSECKIDYMSNNKTEGFVDYLINKVGEGTKLNNYYIIMEDDEIIAYKGNSASFKNKLVTGIVNIDGTIEWIENDNSGISILVTPRSQTEGGVESQTVEIKVESQDWVDWEAKYNWNGSKTQNPEEWKSLTLTGDRTLKEGSATISVDDIGDYYLWIKITTNGQTKIKSYGPYKLGARPKAENIICTMTSTSDNETKGVITVGSNKVFKDWKLLYRLNNGSYEELEQGKTKTVNVVKNDLVEAKYIKDGETDVIKSVQATELKVGYTLQYDTNGGTGGPSSVTQYDNATFTISTTVPKRTGYTFENWNTSKDGSGTTYTPGNSISITETTTLYAIWKEILVEITFDANGGSGTMAKIENIKQNATVVLSANTFTKKGYNFTGWNTSADGNGTSYKDEATIKPSTNIVLYAQWEAPGVSVANYGEYVDLGTSYVKGNALKTGTATQDWRVFYKSKTNRTNLDGTVVKAGTYLILADYLPYSYETKATAGSSTGLRTGLTSGNKNNWKSSTSRKDLIEKLNNTSKWNKLLSSEYIEKGLTVKGGVDLETWVASWNAKGYTKLYTASKTGMTDGLIGYYIGKQNPPTSETQNVNADTAGASNTLYFQKKSNFGYYLTSVSGTTNKIMSVNCNGNSLYNIGCNTTYYGVRPMVYIPLDIGMEKNDTTRAWQIID